MFGYNDKNFYSLFYFISSICGGGVIGISFTFFNISFVICYNLFSSFLNCTSLPSRYAISCVQRAIYMLFCSVFLALSIHTNAFTSVGNWNVVLHKISNPNNETGVVNRRILWLLIHRTNNEFNGSEKRYPRCSTQLPTTSQAVCIPTVVMAVLYSRLSMLYRNWCVP